MYCCFINIRRINFRDFNQMQFQGYLFVELDYLVYTTMDAAYFNGYLKYMKHDKTTVYINTRD